MNVTVTGPRTADSGRVLTSDALDFVGGLHAEFAERRRELLQRRRERWESLRDGDTLSFPADGPARGPWTVRKCFARVLAP